MPSKGRTIQCPLGPLKKKRKQEAPEGSAQVVAELRANESRLFQNQIGQIEQALAATPQGPHQIEVPLIDPDPTGSSESSFVEYICGTYYKKKQLSEARNWTKVLGPMFLTYMICSQKTSQWGNIRSWSLDRNVTCSCGVGDIRTRTVDMVDLLERKQEQVTFCKCTCDQVRLVRKGYIGGSPIHPQTTYSIRLLRFHHILWKYCTVRTQGFALALDEFLDAFNALILARGSNGSNKPRRWRRTFSLAIDAYMLRLEDELSIKSLKLSPLEQLAKNCPRCFGPLQDYDINNDVLDEPHYLVCADGNFQHRRHKAARHEYEEKDIILPSLFIDPKKVVEWEVGGIKKNKDAIKSDPCSAQHTAAADHRGGATWKGCDETGLIGMACRHDHILSYVNVVQAGERQCYILAMIDQLFEQIYEADKPKKRVAVLYDIGCTLEKSIRKNKLFQDECQRRGLTFGTSAFHAYVHEWSCQLLYNPRLNKGWGLSDGEGLERNWSYLSPLISSNRYATKQHRMDGINLKTTHRNEVLCINAAQSASTKLCTAERTLAEAKVVLQRLQTQNPEYTIDYFANQWERQKQSQLDAMSNGTLKKFEEQLIHLLDLEEQLRDALSKLVNLRKKKRQARTDAEKEAAITLPSSIVGMEGAIEDVVKQLGSEEFRKLKKPTSVKAQALIRVRLAKMKLYEAKVGIIVAQRRWDKGGQGTKIQQNLKKLMTKRQLLFKRKWESYRLQVTFEDVFWNVGPLSHPLERWAVDPGTIEGIQSYLKYRSSSEELRRIAREVRQMIMASFQTDEKLDSIYLHLTT